MTISDEELTCLIKTSESYAALRGQQRLDAEESHRALAFELADEIARELLAARAVIVQYSLLGPLIVQHMVPCRCALCVYLARYGEPEAQS